MGLRKRHLVRPADQGRNCQGFWFAKRGERLVRSRIEVQSRERKGGDLSPALYREFINVPLANRNPHLHRIFRLNKHAAPEAWGKLPKNVVIVIQSRTQSSASELRDNSDRPIAALKRFELAHAQVALTLRLGPETTRAVQVQPLTAEQTAFWSPFATEFSIGRISLVISKSRIMFGIMSVKSGLVTEGGGERGGLALQYRPQRVRNMLTDGAVRATLKHTRDHYGNALDIFW